MMLNEDQCRIVEKELTQNIEPRKLAAYLCLHMGLTLAEASAVRLMDFDFRSKMLTIRNSITRLEGTTGKGRFYELSPACNARVIYIPPQVIRLFKSIALSMYSNRECFIISGSTEAPRAHLLQNLLASINNKYNITAKISAGMLREAFIRRCLENGIDIYTISVYIGIKQLSEIQKKYESYMKANTKKIDILDKYTDSYTPSILSADNGKFMNLLILGAGSQGHVLKEIAEVTEMFNKIDFLDDDTANELAIDTCENFTRYVERYPIAIPSFGNCELRKKWADALRDRGFILPRIIHPSATISNQVSIAEGVMIEAKAIIGNGVTIERNCIISAGAVLDKGCTIKENSFIGCASTIVKNAVVSANTWISSGSTFGNEVAV